MKVFRFFTRWILNLSVAYKMCLLVAIVLVGVTCMTCFYVFGMNALSAVQFYIRAEGLWAKAQKDATYSLRRYARTHEEEDYRAFLEFLRVPLGHKKARIELEKPNPDFTVAHQGLIEGGHSPADVQQAATAFRRFRELEPTDKAIRIWAEADDLIAELEEVGAQLHDFLSHSEPATKEAHQAKTEEDELLDRIDVLNEKLTDCENEFSATLNEGSRQAKSLLLTVMLLGAAITVAVALSLAVVIGRDLVVRVNDLVQATKATGKGNLGIRVEVTSNDEIGHLAASFNKMTESQQEALATRKHLEEALHQRQDELEAIYEGMTDGLLIADTENGRFLAANPSICQMLGYSEKELLSLAISDIHPPKDLPDVFEQFMNSSQGKQGVASDLRVMRKDGSVFCADIAAHAVVYNTRQCLVGLFRDITERKKTEQQLKDYAEALESSNKALEEFNEATKAATQAKSEFLANMSHEIRTPMTATLGFSEILYENIRCCSICVEHESCQLREQNKIHVETIRANGEYLLELINDILDLSKIEAGKLAIEKVRCSPAKVVADVMSLMRVRAEAKNLPLETEYVGSLPETIHCDPTRLRQILINLLGNAIKFTEVGGVRLAIRLVEPPDRPSFLQFDVIDTGIGMTEEQASRLFQPFVQAESSTAREFGGTGLGLAISKRLAEMLGGDITISSSLGDGSTFSLTIETGALDGVPMLDNPAEAVAEIKEEKSVSPQVKLDCRILLAEDGPDNQRLISFILTKAGAEVELAEDGQVACEKALAAHAKGEAYDVILMDMLMPNKDGYEATRELRQHGYTGPIIALTANAMLGDDQKCREAGCDDYLTKPIDRSTFLPLIAKYAERQPKKTGVEAHHCQRTPAE